MYLIIYQIEHLLKLNKKLTFLVKMANESYSSGTSNQVGQSKMTCWSKWFFNQIGHPMLINRPSELFIT
jgi:hypothetical protein